MSIYPPMTGLPIGPEEAPTLFLMKRNWPGKRKALRFALLTIRDKLFGRLTATNGAAIQGRLLQIALREGVNIQRNTPMKDFIVEDGRVAGVAVVSNGKDVQIRARGGVLVNAGG